MSRRSSVLVLVTGIALAPGCAFEGDPEDPGLEEIEGVSAGAKLFNQETFGGNGTTCETCHSGSGHGNTGTLSQAQIEARFAANPNEVLFKHDRADVIGGTTFNRFRAHATIL